MSKGWAPAGLLGTRRPEHGTIVAAFSGPGGAMHEVAVRRKPADVARRLTCHATEAVRPPTYALLPETEAGSPSP